MTDTLSAVPFQNLSEPVLHKYRNLSERNGVLRLLLQCYSRKAVAAARPAAPVLALEVQPGPAIPRVDDLMGECKHDGSISVETARERSPHRITGLPDSRPLEVAALRAEPDGLMKTAGAIRVEAGKGNKDSGRDGAAPPAWRIL